MKNAENELKTLLPETTVKIGKTTLTVQPFPFAKLPRVLEIMKGMSEDVFRLVSAAGEHAEAETVNVSPTTAVVMADVIAAHFDEITELMAIYCRVEPDVFKTDDFSIEDAVFIIATGIAGHKSFFTKTLLPRVKMAKN